MRHELFTMVKEYFMGMIYNYFIFLSPMVGMLWSTS